MNPSFHLCHRAGVSVDHGGTVKALSSLERAPFSPLCVTVLEDVRSTSGVPRRVTGMESPCSAQLGLCVCSQAPLNTQPCYVVHPHCSAALGPLPLQDPICQRQHVILDPPPSWIWYVGPGGGRGHSPSLGMCEIQANKGGSCLRFTCCRDGAVSKQSWLCNCGKDRHRLLLRAVLLYLERI